MGINHLALGSCSLCRLTLYDPISMLFTARESTTHEFFYIIYSNRIKLLILIQKVVSMFNMMRLFYSNKKQNVTNII
jgi:hypothetical protein